MLITNSSCTISTHPTVCSTLQSSTHNRGPTQSLSHPRKARAMFRFAHELKFAFMDAFYINLRIDIIVQRLKENNIKKAVFLLDDTLFHLQNVGSDVNAQWKEPLEEEILSLICLLMVGVTGWDEITEHLDAINQLLLRNVWFGEKDRWGSLMAGRLMANKDVRDVGVLCNLPDDIMWKIAQTLVA